MAFKELLPRADAQNDRVSCQLTQKGRLSIGMAAAVMERNKIKSGDKLKLLVDLDSSPRKIRLVFAPDGLFSVRQARGGGGTIIGKCCLDTPMFEKAYVEFDEFDEGNDKVLELELPRSSFEQARASSQQARAAIAVAEAKAANGRSRSV